MSSSKAHLPGRDPVGGKPLNQNVFFKDAAVPFLDAPAPHRPCDYFLHVPSSDPNHCGRPGLRQSSYQCGISSLFKRSSWPRLPNAPRFLMLSIYARTAAYGHFGHSTQEDGGFSWERLDLARDLCFLLA